MSDYYTPSAGKVVSPTGYVIRQTTAAENANVGAGIVFYLGPSAIRGLLFDQTSMRFDGVAMTNGVVTGYGDVVIAQGGGSTYADSLRVPSSILTVTGENTTDVGTPFEVASYHSAGLAALVANAINFKPNGATGLYALWISVNVHTAAVASMDVTVTYQDAGGHPVSKNLAMNLTASPTRFTAINSGAGGAGIYYELFVFSIDNSATNITLSTTGTTQTLYDMDLELIRCS